MTHRIYLDYNATTYVAPEVRNVMMPFLSKERFGNPSSIHSEGRRQRQSVEQARQRVARLCGRRPTDVVFTSGGTESNNLAILGVSRAAREAGADRRLLVSSVEHPSALEPCRRLAKHGFDITELTVDTDGQLDMSRLTDELRDDGVVMVCVQHANSETGVLQDIERIAEVIRQTEAEQGRRIVLHVDCVQSAGKVPITDIASAADSIALSGHKLYAPQGIGALVIADDVPFVTPIQGGEQQLGHRGGTEPTPLIVGFGRACELASQKLAAETSRISELRNRLESSLSEAIADSQIHGGSQRRLPNTTNVWFPRAEAQSLLAALDLAGVAASSGTACSSGTPQPSYVLQQMGRTPEEAAQSIRFSLGRATTASDIERATERIVQTVTKVRGQIHV